MSTFEDQGYKWRETYFVLFEAARRPTLDQVTQRLLRINPRFEVANAEADEDGRFESLTLRSPQDYAAMDISYQSGPEVTEQVGLLQQELKGTIDAADKPKFAKLAKCNGKFDILHFEQMDGDNSADNGDDEDGEMLDPSALLSVMDTLVELTHGVGIDPQSGSIL